MAIDTAIGIQNLRGMIALFIELGGESQNIAGTKFSRYWDLNTAFHNVYLNMSSNVPLLNQVAIIRRRLFEFGKKDWSRKMRQMNYDEHLTLIELIEKRQAVKAADFMRDVHCIINY